ncbi:MAG: tyrosinase family protein [Herminiimonas sp.]|nr:tyrosinase family protein [Herminiimonas sp.]
MLLNTTRRDFMKTTLYGLAAASVAGLPARAQTGLRQRLDWDTFRRSRDYPSYVDAIGKMRANTNAADKRSWQYWTNVHVSFCPHSFAYFLAWHRGYLYHFEQQMRAVSGNRALTLPYWDYYQNPSLPVEFTNPASWNPLYVPRVNANVSEALTLAPFADSVTNMQRGLLNAFEPSLESMPHNPVHNIIGGVMASLQSPTDPIFWLHHANVDRMFSAWVVAGNGRIMPARSDAYWDGTFTYGTRLTLPRRSTVDTRVDLGYFYQNETLPTALAPVAAAFVSEFAGATTFTNAGLLDVAGELVTKKAPPQPPVASLAVTRTRATGPNRVSLGGATRLSLDENSVSARVPLDQSGSDAVQAIVGRLGVSPFRSGTNPNVVTPYTSVQVVLDDVQIAGQGKAGGYFYKVFLQLPANVDSAAGEEKHLLGNIGPFEIAGAEHHDSGSSGAGVRLVFPATQLLRNFAQQGVSELTVSFVRIGGSTPVKGNVITIGECRVEISTDDVQ